MRWLGPIADVTARCTFGDETVKGDAYWAEAPGDACIRPQLGDNGAVVALDMSLNAPLGSRLR